MPIRYLLFALFILCTSCRKSDTAEVEERSKTNAQGLPILLPLAAHWPQPDQAEAKKQAIASYFNKVWSTSNDHVAFLVAQNGHILFEQYLGFAHRGRKDSITANTPLHIASVSKVLTATAILQLVDAGKLQLTDKASQYIAHFPYPDITVQTLLNHRSGLKNYPYFTYEDHRWDRHQTLTNADLVPFINQYHIPLESPTDTRFSYCNTNYAFLALIIEKITGLPYPQAMKAMIFDPLGMTHTFVYEMDKHRGKTAPSYKGNMELAVEYLDGVYGDKNIYSTPRDLLKFDLARYDPQFLNPDLVKKLYSGYSYERKGRKNYGLGMRMLEFDTGENPFYFHNGWWHGNTSSYINLRAEKATIIVLSNKYTKKTYTAKKLAGLFGNYPFHPNQELGE